MEHLSTPEKFLLLAHHPMKGRFMISEIHMKYGLIGAMLLEMSLHGTIRLENGKLVHQMERSEEQHILAEVYRQIREVSKTRSIRYWIRKLAMRSGHYKWLIVSSLEKKRILRMEQRKFVGLIPYKKSHLMNSKLRYDLIREVRKNILQKAEASDEWLVLMGLIEACKMYNLISLDSSERKIIRKKLKLILKESPIAEGVEQTIRQVQAAIIGAVAATSAAAAAGGSR
jgi:hypothetical protein